MRIQDSMQQQINIYRDFPTGKYKAISCDPPWDMETSRSKHRMTYELVDSFFLMNLPVRQIADDDCQLWLWTIPSRWLDAYQLAQLWGFKVKQSLIWIKANGKLQIGFGSPLRNCHEICLVCSRGKPIQMNKGVPSIIVASRREHSRKPDKFYKVIERLNPGPYIDLFAREQRPGWTCWGNQLVSDEDLELAM